MFHQTPQSVENSISCHVIAISTALNVNLLRSMLGIIAVIHAGWYDHQMKPFSKKPPNPWLKNQGNSRCNFQTNLNLDKLMDPTTHQSQSVLALLGPLDPRVNKRPAWKDVASVTKSHTFGIHRRDGERRFGIDSFITWPNPNLQVCLSEPQFAVPWFKQIWFSKRITTNVPFHGIYII